MADGRGRPRSFDKEHALDKALDLFWQNGYLGTSYSDICESTGLSKPSLYAALGNKESTFLSALDRYVSRNVQPGIDHLENEPDTKKAVHELLIATVDGLTAKTTPAGCFIASNASCCNTPLVAEIVCSALHTAASPTRSAIGARLKRAADNDQLSPDTDIVALTCFFDALIAGLSSLAKQGATKKNLLHAVDIAMLKWPE